MPETLESIELTQKLSIKELKDPPYYTPCELRIISFAICFEGMITLIKVKNEDYKEGFTYQARIELGNTEYDLLENFFKIVRLGKIGKEEQQPKPETQNPIKKWQIANMQEALFLLRAIRPIMPCKRKKRIGELLIKFLVKRISQVKKAIEQHTTTVESYTEEQHHIYELIAKLNKRGR